MNAVARAIAAAAKAQQRLAGRPVVYRRGESEIELTVVPGKTTYDLVDLEGHVTTHQAIDFLIAAADLVIDDEPIEPRAGDLIVEEHGDGDHVYELMDLPTAPAWRWSDEQRIRYRVHTKEVEQP